MSWIRTGARHCIWAAIVGLMGFSRLTTATIFVEADVRTCGTATFLGCSVLSGPSAPPTDIKSNNIDFFGSVSVGGPNSSSGSGDAQIDWFHDHFGLLASGSTNTTASDGAIHMGGGEASGQFLDTLVVPVQPAVGLNLGDPGVILLKYHLHGTIHIAAPEFETATVGFRWDYGSGPTGMGVSDVIAESISRQRKLMNTDELFDVIDENVTLQIPFNVGEPQDFAEFVRLTAIAGGIGGPGALVGVAEGDFLHTATLGGAIVLDQFGNPVPDPVVMSDSGFDYVHPGAVEPGSVPEPGSLILIGTAIGAIGLARRRRLN